MDFMYHSNITWRPAAGKVKSNTPYLREDFQSAIKLGLGLHHVEKLHRMYQMYGKNL
jgi:hypothetical protein